MLCALANFHIKDDVYDNPSHPNLNVSGSYSGLGNPRLGHLNMSSEVIAATKADYPVPFPLILLFCLVGVYSLNNNYVEIIVMVFFGIFGYLMKKFEYEAAPLNNFHGSKIE